MPVSFTELEGLTVRIDRVAYVPHVEAPEDRPYAFVYFITIENLSKDTITIKGRKWVVSDSDGEQIVVEGDGVVGKFPRLESGQSFSYNSHHVIASDSVAEGSYIGLTDEALPVLVRIPRFEMKVPVH